MSDLTQRVEAFILNRRLLKPRQSVLVAVSGGVDSMVLLTLLARLAPRHGWRLTVAHFNHQLRGRSADADERLVRKTAKKLKLPCVVDTADVGCVAKACGISIEMAAREQRHGFLARAAKERGIRSIALAHHADDQVELFFLRLLRGAGGQGLAGMKCSNPSPADPRLNLVRPLMECSKQEIHAFAAEGKIPFHEDATNSSFDMLRNRIRHELLPLLTKRYQPALQKVILREMEILGAESEALDDWMECWRREATPPFMELPVAMRRRVLQGELRRLGVPAGFELIERLRARVGRMVSATTDLDLIHDGHGRVRKFSPATAELNDGEVCIQLTGRSARGIFDGLNWGFKIQAHHGRSFPKFSPGCEWFDADAIGASATLRHWRPGDRFQPAGMAKAVKLQDLFTNAKIPREQRRRLAVATTGRGEIWWVEGLRISERFKLATDTRRRLKWFWQRVERE